MSAEPEDFDEEWYLRHNPDVAAVVSAGGFPSGLHHYLTHGKAEGRAPRPPKGQPGEERQDAIPQPIPAGVRYPPHYSLDLDETALLDALERQVGMPPQELLRRFESLGNDCEFGFVQRRCGAEPLGVFRFSNPSAEAVLRLVQANFDGFGNKSFVELDHQEQRREWIVVDPDYDLREHTFIYEGDETEQAVRAQQRARVSLLRRLVIENIREGNKIFVIKSGEGLLSFDIASRIARALRERGPNWLLWVEPGVDVGQVDVVDYGLLHGVIDRLTVQPQAPLFSLRGWLAVLGNAWITLHPQR